MFHKVQIVHITLKNIKQKEKPSDSKQQVRILKDTVIQHITYSCKENYSYYMENMIQQKNDIKDCL